MKRAITGAVILLCVIATCVLSLAIGSGVLLLFIVFIAMGCLAEVCSIVNTRENTARGATFLTIECILIAVATVMSLTRFAMSRQEILVFLVATLVVFAEDAAAMLIGRGLGAHKLPGTLGKISPNKTVEGLFGGLVGGLITGLALIIALTSVDVFSLRAIVVLLIIVIIAPLGDILESAMKREFGIKDSGELLLYGDGPIITTIERFLQPHGGFLDRFDSLWPVIIIVWMLM